MLLSVLAVVVAVLVLFSVVGVDGVDVINQTSLMCTIREYHNMILCTSLASAATEADACRSRLYGRVCGNLRCTSPLPTPLLL